MNTETTNKTNKSPAGWVLYDGRCGFCSASVRRTARLLRHLGYAAVPLQTPWVVDRLGGHQPALADEIGLLTADNRLLGGVDAYVYLAEHWWPTRPLAALARVGWVDGLLRRTYRFIAAHRHQISAACRLHPDLPEGGDR